MTKSLRFVQHETNKGHAQFYLDHVYIMLKLKQTTRQNTHNVAFCVFLFLFTCKVVNSRMIRFIKGIVDVYVHTWSN